MKPTNISDRQVALRLLAAVVIFCVAGFSSVQTASAQTSTWTGSGGDQLWSDNGNWSPSSPNGSGLTADFSQLDITAKTTVHVDSSFTIGNMIFGDTVTNTAAGWVLDNNATSANVLTLAGTSTPVITVNALGGTNFVNISNTLVAASGFVKDGPGILILNASNIINGAVTIKNGTLILGGNQYAGGTNATANAGATWVLGDPAGGPATLRVNLNGFNLDNPISLASGAVGPLTIANYGAQKADFFGNITLNGNNLEFLDGSDNVSSKFLATGTLTGVGNVTLVNNSSSGQLQFNSAINNTGTVTLQGTSANASAFLAISYGANVTGINYVGPAALSILAAPANPSGVFINSSSTSNLIAMSLPAALSNITLNANSSGSITVSTVATGFKGSITNSGTGSSPVYITATIANNTGLSNIVQNSASSPLVLSGTDYYAVPTLVSSGTLLVNGAATAGQSGSPITVASSGTLGGIGSIANLVTVQAGGTLAPGTNAPTTVGTLTFANGSAQKGALSLSGNLYFKLKKTGTTLTNDFMVGTLLTNLGTGTLTLTNIGSTLITNGDKFTLFSSPLMGGNNLTIIAASGKFTNNLAVDGSIIAGNPAPIISTMSPVAGSSGGGTFVTITGSGFVSGATVQFGSASPITANFTSSALITVTSPAQSAGLVTVTVLNPDGQIATTNFTYVSVPAPTISSISPNSGATAGGTLVTINGGNFINGDTVQFGTGSPIVGGFVSSSQLTVTTPAHAAGPVNVTVSDSNNQTYTATGGFTFVAPVTAVWVAPNGGGDGLWTGDTGNWENNTVANSVDQTADFSQGDFTGAQAVHLDGSVTVGNMIFGTTDTGSPVDWTVDNNGSGAPGNTLTLATAAGTPTITVSDPLALGNNAVISAVIAGNQGLALTGGGELTLGLAAGTVTNTFTGGITISNGTLFIEGNAGGNSSATLTLGSTNPGSFATLYLSGAGLPNPIVIPTNAQGTLTISGEPNGQYHPGLIGPPVVLNGNTLTFVSEAGAPGNSLFDTSSGVTGSGNLILVQNSGNTVLNKGSFNNSGSITLQGTGTGTFSLGTMTANVTALNYASSTATVTAPTINVNNNGTTISSSSTLNLPSTGGITIGSSGNNLTLNANSSGAINISTVAIQLGGSIVNSGTGTGITTISASIFNNSAISSIVQDSATSPLVLSGGNYYTVPTLVSNGTLLINGPLTTGQKGSPITVESGGVLGGTGAIANVVTIEPGATLAPGTNDGVTIGTLTLTNGSGFAGALSLAGNLFFKVDNAGSQSNDFVTGTMLLTNIGTGTLTVTNIGPPLNPGDTFQLFSQPLANGNALTILPPNTFINHLAIDGTIVVGSSTTPPPPATGTITSSGSNLTLLWVGGTNQSCVLLTSTNLTNPLINWIPIATNTVGANGLSTNVIPINAGEAKRFYLLEIPSN